MDRDQMKNIQGYILCAVFVLALALGGLLLFLLPHETYSESERRLLAGAPEWSCDEVMSGGFFERADKWAGDHFEGREWFRRIKALWHTQVLREPENNGLAVVGGSIVKLEKEIDGESLSYAAGCFRGIYNEYLADTDCKLYCALIPDKSYFLAGRGYPVMDIEEMERAFYGALPEALPIPVKDALTLNDYYATDSHWRQDRILDAANVLLAYMGGEGDLKIEEFEEKSYEPFYGVYAAQSALNPSPDVIRYFEGGPLEGARLLDYGTMEILPLYDPDECDERDPYTLFLGGPKGFLRIENPNVTDGSRLVIFRDSFGSSIAPLLAARYSSVTLIDTRYIRPPVIRRFLRFEDQDVLFLYSATLLNNSQGLN